ncbi:MAG: hypothetical protein IJA17_10405 [Oscillospiraceae bacterium]|nr:hypothetical protein [Oscillospiraceae bacterium]
MKIPMDLIFPDQEVIVEAEEEFSTAPVLLAAVVVIVAAVLVFNAIKKNRGGRK